MTPPRLRGLRSAIFSASSGSDSSLSWDEEVQQMEAVILAMSQENKDEVRRESVRTLFEKELAFTSVGDAPPHFAQVFGSALDKVGGEVQASARERAEAEQAKSPEGLTPDVVAEDAPYVPYVSREKKPDELQLWALIDMMVQSKMLVRKAITPESNR